MTSATYQRRLRLLNGREDRTVERIAKHLRYWGARHPYPCATCAHPCPGPRCMTTISNPYKLLCYFCERAT